MKDEDFIKLFDAYSNMVYRLAVSYLRNTQDAEDAVQIVFMKLIAGKATIVPGKERAFLTQITINHCKDVLRSFWRSHKESLHEDIVWEEKADRELYHMVLSLPPKYRIAVYLHYYEGYSLSEIAAFLKISASSVSMRLHRARKILKIELGGNTDAI